MSVCAGFLLRMVVGRCSRGRRAVAIRINYDAWGRISAEHAPRGWGEGIFSFEVPRYVRGRLPVLDLIVKFTYEKRIPIHSTRGAFRRRLDGGERERHLRAMEDATSSPGRTRAASSGTTTRPGPTTVKGIKAKMLRWRAARRGA